MQYTLSILVENQAGVLSKISGLFSRRGFNIDSLAVGVTNDPRVSRITIVANGDEYVIEQLEKQLNKVIPVIKVKRLNDGDFISRELILIKVHCAASKRAEIILRAGKQGRNAHRSAQTLRHKRNCKNRHSRNRQRQHGGICLTYFYKSFYWRNKNERLQRKHEGTNLLSVRL